MHHITGDGLADQAPEGFAPEIYICPGGWPTIGYGHLVRDGEQDGYADGIDEATADELLQRDVETAERAVLRQIRVPLEDGQFDALGSFAFNLGAGALQCSEPSGRRPHSSARLNIFDISARDRLAW